MFLVPLVQLGGLIGVLPHTQHHCVAMDTIDYFRRVIEASGYPPELCFAHCLRACSSWRVYRECLTMSTPLRLTSTLATFTSSTVSFPFDLVAPFFCHAFGGTTFRDWCIAEVPGVFTSDQASPRLVPLPTVVHISCLEGDNR